MPKYESKRDLLAQVVLQTHGHLAALARVLAEREPCGEYRLVFFVEAKAKPLYVLDMAIACEFYAVALFLGIITQHLDVRPRKFTVFERAAFACLTKLPSSQATRVDVKGAYQISKGARAHRFSRLSSHEQISSTEFVMCVHNWNNISDIEVCLHTCTHSSGVCRSYSLLSNRCKGSLL